MKNYLRKYGVITLLSVGVLWLPGLVADRHIQDRYVSAARECLPKTTMIRVIVEVPAVTMSLGDNEVYRSTETVLRTILGSGVFINTNGHILTCAHLFKHGETKSIGIKTYGGMEYAAELLTADTGRDLALLKINEYTPNYARLATNLIVGQEVIAIGQPLAFEWSVTHGIISYIQRENLVIENVNQTDTFINPGNSGGPLFNLDGELVGINSFIVPPVNAPIFTGLGFSVSTGEIQKFLGRFRGL